MRPHHRLLVERIRTLSRPLEPLPTGQQPLPPARVIRTRTLVFDIYGTLLISASGDVGTTAEDNREALAEALHSSGIAGDPAALIDALHMAIGQRHTRAREEAGIDYPEIDIRECWRDAFQATGTPVPSPENIERLAVEYECRINPVWPMPGADRLLAWARDSGYRLGILSNAQFYTPLVLEALFDRTVGELGFDPELCLWSWQTGHGKPSPHLFATLHERLPAGQSPLYVGNDMLKDIWPATQRDWYTALFAGDARSLRLREDDPRLQGVRPDAVIIKLIQITKIIE